ncbi:MAG: ecdysteroid kinase [Ilumatobacteraceae bacterium]|nr:ecdysteroid kinase [Ilumatobacteraceae bacterium]
MDKWVRGDPLTIDGPWMTEALQAAGVANGATVTDVRFDGFVGTGQMSRNARLSLTWDRPEGRPPTIVGKFPTDDPSTRASSFANGAYFSEFAFYDSLAATVDICTPACWVARFDVDEPDFVLIMEDMSGSVQGDQFTGCSMDETSLAIEQAAALHSPRWGDPTLADAPALRGDGSDRGERLEQFFSACAEACLARLGHGLDADVVQLIRDFVPRVRPWAGGTGTPQTVVHGDFRPDNFLIGRTAEAPPLAVVDWQTISRGLGVIDVAYLVGGSFPPETRPDVEHDLLEEYRGRINAAGIDYTADQCWLDYRWGTLHGVIISVLATIMAEQTERGDAMLTLMATRHARHALDLDALSLLG